MSGQDFQLRVRSFRRAIRPLAIACVIYVLTGPFITWPLLMNFVFHWCHTLFDSEAVAFWLTFMSWVLTFAVPLYLTHRIRRHYGLICPKCQSLDVYCRFMRGVLKDGRCPYCKTEILDGALVQSSSQAV